MARNTSKMNHLRVGPGRRPGAYSASHCSDVIYELLWGLEKKTVVGLTVPQVGPIFPFVRSKARKRRIKPASYW